MRRTLAAAVLVLSLLTVPMAASAQTPEPPPTTQGSAGPEVVGGTVASPGEYPYQVALLRRSVGNNFNAQFCGGSVVSAFVILTAGHCIQGMRAGDIDVLINTTNLDVGGTRVPAKRIRQHPEYDDFFLDYDVAVVEVADPLPVSPVRVIEPGEETLWAGGTTATVTGWGAINASGTNYPSKLREVDLTLRTDQHCRSALGPDFHGDNMLCAGEIAGGVGSCFGDSGGPIVVDDGGEWVQVGIVSWGADLCAQPNSPGVYSQITAAEQFVRPYVGRNHPFADAGLWLADAVAWVYDEGFMTGYSNCTFRPNLDLTRAQAVRLLWRLAGEPAVADPHGFSDVPAWVEPAVRWAAKDPDGGGVLEPVIEGFPNDTFRPDVPVSRGQWTRMLYRDAGSPVGAPGHSFTDGAPWIDDAIDWITDPGRDPRYAEGFADNTYRPNASITRGQATRSSYRIYSGA